MVCKEFTCILFLLSFVRKHFNKSTLFVVKPRCVWVPPSVCVCALWPGNSLYRNDLVARDDCTAFGWVPFFASYFSLSFHFFFSKLLLA